MPSLSSVRTLSTCCLLVSGFFTEIAQQIHSLRARGVRSSQIASASASEARVCRKSSGNSWTTPPEMSLLVVVIRLFYYKRALSCKERKHPASRRVANKSIIDFLWEKTRVRHEHLPLVREPVPATPGPNAAALAPRLRPRSCMLDHRGETMPGTEHRERVMSWCLVVDGHQYADVLLRSTASRALWSR